MIIDIHKLARNLENRRKLGEDKIVVTSGGFDPLHIGHVRCIQESARIANTNNTYQGSGVLIVIVNGDGFLTRKKGKPFMPHQERMEIINALHGVDYVTGWDDGSQTVVGALELLKPHFFCKGGDRSTAANVPEFDVCDKLKCMVVFGVGGTDKVQSSSDLIKLSKKEECYHTWVMDGHNAGDPICSKCLKR